MLQDFIFGCRNRRTAANNKGSDDRCDPTVRAPEKSDAISRIRSLAKVIVSLTRRKGKAHYRDLSQLSDQSKEERKG
jgi:hypothetical protein